MNLDLKPIGKIKGEFYIPAYQRGYRWKEEVEMLLNDIHGFEDKFYCLQPIVVRDENGRYELIDGQQRITTIYLIYKYLSGFNGLFPEPKFSIEYETRKDSKSFLHDINTIDLASYTPKNIDEYFIKEAYKCISQWFEHSHANNMAATIMRMFPKLDEKVQVLWYEVDSNVNSTELFARLNIGKIPLTNAELIRALFLSRNNGIDDDKQLEIATQWDTIEKELHNDSFWYFLTNDKPQEYPTRIELIFDLMAPDRKPSLRRRFDTFFYFDDRAKNGGKADIWKDVLLCYYRLKEWYDNFDIYHKVGYLIATSYKDLKGLLAEYKNKTKTQFQEILNTYIKESLPDDCSDLKYGENSSAITRVLLLYNIETIRQKNDPQVRFSFARHKDDNWSLEHIHAQHSEGLNKNETRLQWIKDHRKSLQQINDAELIERMNNLERKIEDPKDNSNIGKDFNELFEEVMKKLTADGSEKYMHTLANMALLPVNKNAALNNSAFDVKRSKIISMSNDNEYIPICTLRVFMKYYSSSVSGQLYLWGEADRKGYIADMNKVMAPYLKQEINIEEE